MLVSPGVIGVTGVLLELSGTDRELLGSEVVEAAELLEIMLLDVVPLDMTLLCSDEDVPFELISDEMIGLLFIELLELSFDEVLELSGWVWTELAVS